MRDQAGALFQRLLDCVFDAEALSKFLNELALSANATAAQLKVTVGDRDVLQSSVVGDADHSLLKNQAAYEATCPRLTALLAAPVGALVRDEDFIRETEVQDHPAYRDLYIPARIARFAGARIDETDSVSLSVGVLRPIESAPFGQSDIARIEHHLRELMPAAKLIGRLRRRDNRRLLEMFPADVAAATCDRAGRIVDSNSAFDRLVSAGRIGLKATGKVRLAKSVEARFDSSIAGLKRVRAVRRIIISDEQDDAKLVATLHHVPSSAGLASNVAAALTIEPMEERRTRLDAEIVISTFGLTRSEAVVAGMLCAGHSPREIAARRAVTLHTVRSMIKSIMRKTETSRQAELISLLAGLTHYGR